jgi:ferredoxin-thioredoxin reductase catalytic chain
MGSKGASGESKGPKAPASSETPSKEAKVPESPETPLEELKAKIRAQMEEYARQTGYRLNPDREVVDSLITAFAKRTDRFGQPYCPCRVMTGDPEKDKAIICPCIYHREEIAGQGICHCHLFCSPEYEAAHRQGEHGGKK